MGFGSNAPLWQRCWVTRCTSTRLATTHASLDLFCAPDLVSTSFVVTAIIVDTRQGYAGSSEVRGGLLMAVRILCIHAPVCSQGSLVALGGNERACLFLSDEARVVATHPKLVKRAKVA